MMDLNISESVSWPQTDILITTPKMLYRILEQKAEEKKDITPKYLIIDEADHIFQSKDLLTYIFKNISFLHSFLGKDVALKYFLSAPTKTFLEDISKIDTIFPKIDHFRATDYAATQTLFETLKCQYFKVQAETQEEVFSKKLEALVKIVSN